MVLGSPVGYPFEDSISMLLGLALDNYSVTWEGYLVGVSLGTLDGLMIGTGKGYLVGLSLGLPLGYPLESLNLGAGLPGTLMGAPLGLWFGSKAVSYRCCFRYLTDYCEATCKG